jgi:aminoglycoside 3-N-acetyltransferase
MMGGSVFITRESLRDDLERMGIGSGDTVMVHAAMRKVGRLLNGPDALIMALRAAVGTNGTLVAYTDWDACYNELLDEEGRVPAVWRDVIPPFDPKRSRAIRDNGVFPEFLRTTPGACRSDNPGASVAAIGALAGWITRDHPLDYGYGEGSPFAKLTEIAGKVLMVGAPWDTMTLLHYAEHLAAVAGKRVLRYEVPFVGSVGAVWRMTTEFDTGRPVIDQLADDYFGQVVTEYVLSGEESCRTGSVGNAESLVVNAARIVPFAVKWLERRANGISK